MRLTIKISCLLCILIWSGIDSFGQSITDSIFTITEVKIISQTPLEERGLIKTNIDKKLIKSGSHKDLADLLTQNSSLFIKSYGQGSLATASFRGTASSHTVVHWNGISLNNPMAGQVDFSLIPILFIDEINILHGGSSLYDGSGALGGSINLKTLPGWNDTLRISLGQSIGSFGTFGSNLDLRFGKKKIQTRIRIYREQSDNDFVYFNDLNGEWNYETQENAGYLKTGLLHELHFRTESKDLISLTTWIQKADRNFAPMMTYDGGGRTENQKDLDVRSSFIWKKYIFHGSVETVLGWNHSNVDYYASDKTEGGEVPHFDTENRFNTFTLKNKLEIDLGKDFLIRNLIDFSFHDVSSFDKEILTGYKNNRTIQGNTLSIHKGISKRISGYGMLRTEICDWKFIPLMPSLGLEINTLRNDNLIFRANATKNYHLPNLNDLYWIPGGNDKLKPEQGYSSDLSVEYSGSLRNNLSLNTSFNAYYSIIDNWILWTPGDYGYWTAENMKKVSASGFEYHFSSEFKMARFSSRFFTNYSYTRTINLEDPFENADMVGKQLIYVPIHKANSQLRIKFNSNYCSYNYRFVGKRYTTSSNDDFRRSLPGYELHGFIFGKEFRRNKISYDINMKFNNLLDSDYQAVLERAMPGRNFIISLNLKF